MSRIDKELLNIVRKIRNRIHAVKLIEYALLGIIAALILGIAILLLSRFLPIYNPYGKTAIALGVFTLIALLYGLFKRPTKRQTALQVDSLGLKERIITAMELMEGDTSQSVFAQLEKKDALDKLKKLDYKKGIPVKVNKIYLIICIILSATLALAGFIPNPMTSKANDLHKNKQKITAQQKKVEEMVKQVKADAKLTKKQKEELEKKLSELKKELKAAKNEKEIDKALKKTEKKLELLKQEQDKNKESLNKLADTLSKNQITKALSDMLKNKDEKALKQELKELEKAMKNINKDDIKKLAEDLAKLAQELESNAELSKALSDLSSKLAKGELGNLSEAMEQLGEAVQQLMNDEDVNQALSEIQKQLQKMQSGQNTSQNQSGQKDNGHVSSGGQGSQSGQGQGNQAGQQNGQGKGSGAGAGSGTDMGTENPTPTQPSGGISKKGSSEKKTGEYEKIFTPKTLGGDGEQSNLNGSKGSGGNTEQIITDQSPTVAGNLVPYNQVLGQYKSSAFESMNSSDIPTGMKDIVKDYFSSLDD